MQKHLKQTLQLSKIHIYSIYIRKKNIRKKNLTTKYMPEIMKQGVEDKMLTIHRDFLI